MSLGVAEPNYEYGNSRASDRGIKQNRRQELNQRRMVFLKLFVLLSGGRVIQWVIRFAAAGPNVLASHDILGWAGYHYGHIELLWKNNYPRLTWHSESRILEKPYALGLQDIFEKYIYNDVEEISKCSARVVSICKNAKNPKQQGTPMWEW